MARKYKRFLKRLKILTSFIVSAELCLLMTVGDINAQRGGVPSQLRGGEGANVAFPPTTTFSQAIQILSQISRDVEGKVIIDPTNQQGPINVSVPSLNWKRALEMILRANGLEFVERATYYETRPSGSGVAQPSGPALPLENELTLNSRQVEISAIFFQGDRGSIAEAGIDWSMFSRGNVNFDVSSIAATNVTQNFLRASVNYTAEAGAVTITTLGILRAFEALNIGTIISKPSIIVLDGAEGMIQVGQSFSIKQKDFAGNTTDKFFEVGTILKVTPQIIRDRDVTFIHIDLAVEKSTAFPDAVSTRIDKQLAKTQILLLDGEQTMIAGLFTDESQSVRKGIPILKDLPWWFFGLRFLTGFSSVDKSEGELIIIIRVDLVPSLTERIERRRAELDEIIEKERVKFQEDLKKLPSN
ncbi:MAG: hypothetical protein IIC40_01285 [Candidatus Marinimicrobia bacterium]|nr:hypothetical protein [Candidatus Neomarinimicrobiota bacterium]